MEITNYGMFTTSEQSGILYFENEQGESWYDLLMGRIEDKERLVVLTNVGGFVSSVHAVWAAVDSGGNVTNVESDPSRIVPDAKTVLGVDAAIETIYRGMRFIDGEFLPPLPVPPPATVLYPVDLWSRLTEAEADQVEAAMLTQSVRIQNIFRTASSYRSDHDLWPLLENTAVSLFGADRAAQILSPSE